MQEKKTPCPRWPAAGLSAALVIASLASCSSRQFYDSAQGWQRNECHRMPDPTERGKCLSSTSTSYEDYKRQSDGAKANGGR